MTRIRLPRPGRGDLPPGEPTEGQQSLFSWAEFLAEEPAQPQGRSSKSKSSSLSLFELALVTEQERWKEPVGGGR